MTEAKSDDSSKSLLEEIEGDWDSPAKPASTTERKLHAELDAAADKLIDDLDAGWDDEEEEEEEPEEEEPELPDERLDPVAYAEAKKAREERIEARAQKKRAKAEAKKARRKARAEAARSKQKGKSKKSRPPQQPARPSKKDRRAASAKAATDNDDELSMDASDDAEGDDAPIAPRKLPPSRPMSSKKPLLQGTNTWMLAVAVAIFVAAAIFAAVITR